MRLRIKRVKARVAEPGRRSLRPRVSNRVPVDRLVVRVRLSAKGWGARRPEVEGARCRFARSTGRVPIPELWKLLLGLYERFRELAVPIQEQKKLVVNLWRKLERRDWIELPHHRRASGEPTPTGASAFRTRLPVPPGPG